MKIATIDFETTPFKFGRVPVPFAWGFFDGERYVSSWGEKDCAKSLVEFLLDYQEPLYIYAHNGGKFDFLFFLERLNKNIRVVNGRVLEGSLGQHTLRDSYAAIPIPLSKYDKGSIDYKLMEPELRDENRDEIEKYLERDCRSLHELVTAFVQDFGDVLTIGSASMREFKKYYKLGKGTKAFDGSFRQFYFGGRCECFEKGIIETPVKIYDVNSMYPSTMRDYMHPISIRHSASKYFNNKTMFVKWQGENNGAVPTREKFGLNFNVEKGTFFSTGHEFRVALDLNLIKPKKILCCYEFAETLKFDDFVDYFYGSREIAKKHGDKFKDIFYKLVLNSPYGKCAQNPEHYCSSIILPWGEFPEDYSAEDNETGWFIEYRHADYAIWSKPASRDSYYNVATAASITGASRSVLLRGVHGATRPLYCDTDSIICSAIGSDCEISNSKLGAWKLEDEGDLVAIAGKKLYAIMCGDVCVKKASKGVFLPPMAIFDIARGETVTWRNEAPSMKLDGAHIFIERNISMT